MVRKASWQTNRSCDPRSKWIKFPALLCVNLIQQPCDASREDYIPPTMAWNNALSGKTKTEPIAIATPYGATSFSFAASRPKDGKINDSRGTQRAKSRASTIETDKIPPAKVMTIMALPNTGQPSQSADAASSLESPAPQTFKAKRAIPTTSIMPPASR